MVAAVAVDADGEIVDILVEIAEELEAVGGGFLGRGAGVLADVAPYDGAAVGFAQAADGGFETPVGAAGAVDDGVVFGQPEDAGAGIARLGPGRERADLHEPESCRRQLADDLAVAVDACGQPDRVGKPQSEDFALENRMPHGETPLQQPASAGQHAGQPQQPEDEAVRPLDAEREKQGPDDPTIHNGRKSKNYESKKKNRESKIKLRGLRFAWRPGQALRRNEFVRGPAS